MRAASSMRFFVSGCHAVVLMQMFCRMLLCRSFAHDCYAYFAMRFSVSGRRAGARGDELRGMLFIFMASKCQLLAEIFSMVLE